MNKGKYSKTDFNFSTARSVLRIAYLLVEILCLLGIVVGVGSLFGSNGIRGVSVIFSSLLAGLVVHLIYAFNVGFFELIKHAREIRDELVGLRTKSVCSGVSTSDQANTIGRAGGMRYDAVTHQYVKA